MPRGNRQGPGGAGPKTGRGEGFCGGGDHPGFQSEVERRHMRSRGIASGSTSTDRGERRRIRRHLHASDENRLKVLRQEADLLKSQARAIEQEIKHLSGEPGEETE